MKMTYKKIGGSMRPIINRNGRWELGKFTDPLNHSGMGLYSQPMGRGLVNLPSILEMSKPMKTNLKTSSKATEKAEKLRIMANLL